MRRRCVPQERLDIVRGTLSQLVECQYTGNKANAWNWDFHTEGGYRIPAASLAGPRGSRSRKRLDSIGISRGSSEIVLLILNHQDALAHGLSPDD